MQVQYDGSYVAQKHFALGRVATELGYVMPDRRTVRGGIIVRSDDRRTASSAAVLPSPALL